MQGIAQKVMAEPGKYSLQQLQQAVQSGSLPAYIGIPLIQEKLKQQKDMQGMEQGQSPQGPSIAEQVMQEAQGVQALPSNLPQEYAGGGIVAFEQGGEVERYQSDGLVRPGIYPYNAPEAGRFKYSANETPEERRRREFLATPEGRAAQIRADRAGLLTPFAAAGDVLAGGPLNALSATTEGIANLINFPRFGRALGIYDPNVTRVQVPRVLSGGPTPFMDKLRAYAAGQQPVATAATTPEAAAPPIRIQDTGKGILGGMVSPNAAQPAPTVGQRPPAGNRAGAPAAARAPQLTAPGGESFSAIADRGISDYATSARNAEVGAEAEKAAARSKVTGQAFDEYKKSLEEEAKQAGAERGQAKNMALFKAGLAMMAGTSRHALENIGLGALRGAEDYQAAVKDLKRAERERRKELSHIEQARRAEKIGDRDTAVREFDAARDRADAVAKYRTKALMDGAGLDKQQAMDLQKTQFAADTDIFKTERAGQYTVEAAKVRASNAGAGRGALTQGQLLNARMQAMRQVDENEIRNQVAKQLGFSKVPKPGADTGFDTKVTTAYDQAVSAIVNSAMGTSNIPGGGGNPYQGFRIVPEE